VTAQELLRKACTSQSPPLSSEFYETYCSSPSKETLDTVRVRAPRQARYRPDRRSATQFEGPQHVSGRLDRWAALVFCVPKSSPLCIASRPHGQNGIRVVAVGGIGRTSTLVFALRRTRGDTRIRRLPSVNLLYTAERHCCASQCRSWLPSIEEGSACHLAPKKGTLLLGHQERSLEAILGGGEGPVSPFSLEE
jgi:hypothetical protein